LDDTLIVSDVPYRTLWESSVKLFAAELGELEFTTLYKSIRTVSDWYWGDPERHRQGRLDLPTHRRLIVKMALEKLGCSSEGLASKIADEYSLEREHHEILVPRTIETLEELRRYGLKLALITNGGAEIQRAKMKKFQIEPYFDNILIEGEFGCGKPDERVFRHTLEKFNVSPAAAWMVGDDLGRDIAPCNTLGIYALWVNPDGRSPAIASKVHPDRIIKTIAEIPEML
jgi:putative hydrolase of the HAD superfamily